MGARRRRRRIKRRSSGRRAGVGKIWANYEEGRGEKDRRREGGNVERRRR